MPARVHNFGRYRPERNYHRSLAPQWHRPRAGNRLRANPERHGRIQRVRGDSDRRKHAGRRRLFRVRLGLEQGEQPHFPR